jgi:hypothetical protein
MRARIFTDASYAARAALTGTGLLLIFSEPRNLVASRREVS